MSHSGAQGSIGSHAVMGLVNQKVFIFLNQLIQERIDQYSYVIVFLYINHFIFQLHLYEFENFQGRKMELFSECGNLCEKGFERIGSIKVESGP